MENSNFESAEKKPRILTLDLPEYTVDKQPDFEGLGKRIDEVLKANFLGRDILVRALGSQEHSEKTTEELIKVIQETGSDRYDPDRKGDRYENIEGKHIDFFAMSFHITESGEYFKDLLAPFYLYPPEIRNAPPIRIDIAIIYDLAKVEAVEHQYEGREGEIKTDGYIFKNHEKKPDAIEAIIHIR